MRIKINEPWITGKVRCQNGYAYIDKPFWNADKQQADHKREYIGKYDGKTFTPNKTFHRLKTEYENSLLQPKIGPVLTEACLRQFYGATYLLDRICDKIGVAADLGKCFGSLTPQILSISYYLIIEEGLPLHRFYRWGLSHRHPYGKDIPSWKASELFGLITKDARLAYLKAQAKRHSCKEYIAFDTTFISSYSTLIEQVKYGKNKEGDSLPQIELALLYGKESMLPVYYRKLAGNIADVKRIENLIRDVDFLKLEKLKLVMDCGVYSEKNINDLMKHHHKFLISAKLPIRFVSLILDREREGFVTRFNYNSELKLYIKSFTEEWDYTEEKPRTGETISDKRRIYLHIYYNGQQANDDKTQFNAVLDRLEYNVINGTIDPDDEDLYQRYFTIHETSVMGKTYSFKEEAIHKAEKNYGYFVLISNGIKDPVEALQIYLIKDLIEKSFCNLKERLSMHRMSVASEENIEGKLFVQFIALQLMSYIKKQMDENGLFKDYTMQSLLDELDTIEYYQQPGGAHYLSEVTEKQRKLYELMDVQAPS